MLVKGAIGAKQVITHSLNKWCPNLLPHIGVNTSLRVNRKWFWPPMTALQSANQYKLHKVSALQNQIIPLSLLFLLYNTQCIHIEELQLTGYIVYGKTSHERPGIEKTYQFDCLFNSFFQTWMKKKSPRIVGTLLASPVRALLAKWFPYIISNQAKLLSNPSDVLMSRYVD